MSALLFGSVKEKAALLRSMMVTAEVQGNVIGPGPWFNS